MTMFNQLCALTRLVPMLILMLSTTSGAATQENSSTFASANDCKGATTTSAMRACENARYEVAQHELNAAYQSLSQHLDSGQRQKLRVAQNAWIRFRDADTAFESSLAQGGTLAPMIRIGSLTEMTRARVSELKKTNPQ
jgi:uncharacterized protein YecT (DUF1311 family)